MSVSASVAPIAPESCSALVWIFIAGAPSAVAAVATLPAFALTFSKLSSASDSWIARYGSTIDAGIGLPSSGVLPPIGAGVHAATATSGITRNHETTKPRNLSRLWFERVICSPHHGERNRWTV